MTDSKGPADPAQSFDELVDTYNEVLRDCYHALEADAPQEKRDALRTAIRGFVDKQRARKRKEGLDGHET